MICILWLALVPPIALCWMILLALTVASPSAKKFALSGVWQQSALSAPLILVWAVEISNEELLMPVFVALSLLGVVSAVLAAKVHKVAFRSDAS